METRPKILLVEDDPILAGMLVEGLSAEGFLVSKAGMLSEARIAIKEGRFDLVILDLILPDGESFSLIKEIKDRMSVPVIFLTVKSDEETIVRAFREGASDYIRKPFGQRELVMRIKRLLPPSQLILDKETNTVKLARHRICLGRKEFEIFSILVQKNGDLVKREEIEAIFGSIDKRTVDSHISHLRIKLSPLSKVFNIRAIYGLGYRLEQK
ncbi:MAG: response regulator transcription factor [Bdellovibrionales bacterium]|nr:response regulator transcription factor [Bdellovibrionales bacterium]